MKTVTISKEKYNSLLKKAQIADDILGQMDRSLKDIETGRIRKAVH
jgi:hypothetical protein